jgi:membrane associated rhomboid family serine protease
MFPVSDDNSQRRTLPVVTYALIALNVVIFFVELNAGDEFIKDWGVHSRTIFRRTGCRRGDDRHRDVHAWQLASSL